MLMQKKLNLKKLQRNIKRYQAAYEALETEKLQNL